MRNRKYTECRVIECEHDRSFGQSPIFPHPLSILPGFLRARHPLFYRATSARGNLLTPPPKCLLCIFLRTTEKRRIDSYICTSNRTDTCPTTCQICRFAFQNGTPEAVANNDNVRPSDILRHLNRMPLLLRLSKRYTDQNNNSTRVNFIPPLIPVFHESSTTRSTQLRSTVPPFDPIPRIDPAERHGSRYYILSGFIIERWPRARARARDFTSGSPIETKSGRSIISLYGFYNLLYREGYATTNNS